MTFHFTGVEGRMAETETLTSGMIGKEVKLEFSKEWDNLKKTAVFTAGSVTRDVMNVSDVAVIPAEVLTTPLQRLYVGVYGVCEDGKKVIPTIRVEGPWILPGVNPSGDESTDPGLPVWTQLDQRIAKLEENETDNGSSEPADGITPHIGENGNWYIGTADTGVKAKGEDGKGIQTITRTSGTGAAGTTDTYTITYTDGTTSTYTVHNGKDGAAATFAITGAAALEYGAVPTVTEQSGSTAQARKYALGIPAGKPARIVAQPAPPEDTAVLWVDTSDESYEGVSVASPLFGKSISFNGDSVCAGGDGGGGYGKIIANRNSMVYQNIAVGGATIAAETYSNSSGKALHWICRTISEMNENADYAIVEGGVNDPNYVENMGSLSSGFDAALDDTTFYGAFESMLKQLIERFPGKKIGYIAVHKFSANFDSRTAGGCYQAARACCEKWGVPFCDLNTTVPPFGDIPSLSGLYTLDGEHPNEAGYKKYYCDKIEAWLKTL